MSPAEIVQYEREHPRGFNLANKRLLESRGFPPGGPISDPFKEIIPYDCELQADSWAKLSVEERMLAIGYEILSENGESYEPYPKQVRLPHMILGAMAQFYTQHERNPKSADELLEWRVSNIMAPVPEGYEPYDVQEALDNQFSLLTSPVTGRLVEFDDPNFSPGNIYVTVMNDKPDMVEIEQKYEAEMNYEKNYPEAFEKRKKYGGEPIYSYYRVFGQTGVISHGDSVIIPKKKD